MLTTTRFAFGWLFVAILGLALVRSALAQGPNDGSVLGVITDTTGSVIPGVGVSLRNTEKGGTFSAATDREGRFEFQVVPAGEYEIKAEKVGFKQSVRSAFAVHASEHVRVDAVLAVGTVTETVTVSDTPSLVNTTTANEGNTVTGEQVNTLPLTNRVFTQLVTLEPGVSAPFNVTPGFGSNSGVNFAVNGVRPDENNLLVDGIRNVDTFGGNAFVTPNLFAISEFRVESNDYSATSGRSAGAAVNLITRSGTNRFHGDAFEFFRNDKLNAPFRESGGIKPENRYNDFGYDVGGPILRDRLFFFWSQEWRRIIQSGGVHPLITPTAAERGGDFSARPEPIIDPNTGLQFPGNLIPSNRLNANAQLLLQTYFPLPNVNGDGFNYISQDPDFTRFREEQLRIDAKLNNKLNLFGRFTQDSVMLSNPYGLFGENPYPKVGGSTQNFPIYNWSVHLSYAPTPTLFMEFTTGMYFGNDKALANGPLSNRNRAPGLNVKEVFPLNEGNRIPTIFLSSGYSGIVEQWFFHNDAFSIPFQSANTWIKGRHTIRFGVDFTPEGKSELANPSNNNTNGSFNFDGSITGNALADMLLGTATNYTETALDPFGKYRWFNLEPYVEDQVKFRNVTLTAALRYEYYQPEYEAHNNFGAFVPSLWNPANAPTVNPDGTIVPDSGDLLNGIVVAGKNSPYGRALFPTHKNAFAPRLGIAWDPFGNGKTSIRAGYGIFYDRWGSYSQFGLASPPFNSSVSISQASLDNPGGSTGALFPSGLNAPLAPWKYPTIHKWSLGVQREVLADTTATIGYVGTRGTHLLGNLDINQGLPSTQVAEGLISPDSIRPFRGFASIQGYADIFNSNYHSLQASLLHRLKHGVSFQASYTYSKVLTDNSGPNAYPSFPQNSYNIHGEYGPADFDLTHILTINYSWDLPFFKSTHGIAKAALDGWQLSGITSFQSGQPLTVIFFGDPAGVFLFGKERPNQVASPFVAGPVGANPGCVAPARVHTRDNWFNPCAFQAQDPGTFGNEHRGALRGPHLQNWDFSLMKNFFLHEGVGLQFRAEAFNLFNHPNLGGPDTAIDDGQNFSKVLGSLSPRILQISLSLKF